MKTDIQMLRIDITELGSGTEPSVHKRAPPLHAVQGVAVTRVEPDDLVRLEGEGGLEAPETAAPHHSS